MLVPVLLFIVGLLDDATCLYGFVMEFFFRTSLNVDR